MEGCRVPVPTIDEAELLADIRSPNFLEACKKLRIDPIDLKPRSFASVSLRRKLHTPPNSLFSCSSFCRTAALLFL